MTKAETNIDHHRRWLRRRHDNYPENSTPLVEPSPTLPEILTLQQWIEGKRQAFAQQIDALLPQDQIAVRDRFNTYFIHVVSLTEDQPPSTDLPYYMHQCLRTTDFNADQTRVWLTISREIYLIYCFLELEKSRQLSGQISLSFDTYDTIIELFIKVIEQQVGLVDLYPDALIYDLMSVWKNPHHYHKNKQFLDRSIFIATAARYQDRIAKVGDDLTAEYPYAAFFWKELSTGQLPPKTPEFLCDDAENNLYHALAYSALLVVVNQGKPVGIIKFYGKIAILTLEEISYQTLSVPAGVWFTVDQELQDALITRFLSGNVGNESSIELSSLENFNEHATPKRSFVIGNCIPRLKEPEAGLSLHRHLADLRINAEGCLAKIPPRLIVRKTLLRTVTTF